MTVSTPVTYQGAVALIGATDVSDEMTTFTLTPDSRLAQMPTFGNSSVSARGVITWEGEATAVYDNTSGSAYKLLKAAAVAGTATSLVFRPEGTATGNEGITVSAILGEGPIEAEADGGIQIRVFPFMVTGTPTFANQA